MKVELAAKLGEIEQAGHALRAQLLSRQGTDTSWLQNLEEADTRAIIVAIAGLAGAGRESISDAARDTARSMLELKLTDHLIERMVALEAASTRLGWIGVFIGVVGVIVAIAIAAVSA